MRMRIAALVVPLLVLELAACGQPAVVERTGTALPVPAGTGVPGCSWLGDTPVAPDRVIVKLQPDGSSVR
jgi:hypothetical protein